MNNEAGTVPDPPILCLGSRIAVWGLTLPKFLTIGWLAPWKIPVLNSLMILDHNLKMRIGASGTKYEEVVHISNEHMGEGRNLRQR